ncbi:hypothetical protein LSUB1_G002313 [Lachnellula subtilissima]|uniref:CCZ1/INTU/HSP4 first Longin domain-containing protein n=1 Tax=Lachnellula subtilissima TaxID=602034 RepID=A0A8H8RMV9_9HELO|nr:hypothetical protein LSUB1_G002313 [Lachnellula subtilissima]
MSLAAEHLSGKIIPAQLNFLAIYNPSLGTTDDTVADQIVYYYSAKSPERSRRRHSSRSRIEESNAQLREIGLAQGMVEFGKSFSDGRSVDTIETEKSRIVLHELESGCCYLYGGIKIAACGELGVGVGEEERGSGEREVLEGFVGRVDGLVDIIVSRFGVADEEKVAQTEIKKKDAAQHPTNPWLGSGNDPAAEDGAIFLGTGALSRKSLRDVSHWMEDLYRWGPYAYGVVDNPTSIRRAKMRAQSRKECTKEDEMATIPPRPIVDVEQSHDKSKRKLLRPQLHRGASSHNDTDSESSKSVFVHYLKLGYGTHWSFGGTTSKGGGLPESAGSQTETQTDRSLGKAIDSTLNQRTRKASPAGQLTISDASPSKSDSFGHYLIGLLGAIEDEHDDKEEATEDCPIDSSEEENSRLVLRTLTLESEREEDARTKGEISIDLGNTDNENMSSKHTSSEHTATSNTSFETQDRNKAKKITCRRLCSQAIHFRSLVRIKSRRSRFPRPLPFLALSTWTSDKAPAQLNNLSTI